MREIGGKCEHRLGARHGWSWRIASSIVCSYVAPFHQHLRLPICAATTPRMLVHIAITVIRACREEWQVGAREDWRYALMAKRMGRVWWAIASFFAVGVTQQLMLVGITLPLLAIHTSTAPWDPLVDTAIFLSAATGEHMGVGSIYSCGNCPAMVWMKSSPTPLHLAETAELPPADLGKGSEDAANKCPVTAISFLLLMSL